jgi:translation elongation factor EF-Ts
VLRYISAGCSAHAAFTTPYRKHVQPDGRGERAQQGSVRVQVAAMRPLCIARAEVPADLEADERAILTERATVEAGKKPANIIDRIVAGRMSKFYEEVVLLEQPFILDDKRSVRKVLEAAGKAAGCMLTVANFAVLKAGEAARADAPAEGA